jgi:hypothetical protein
MRPFVVGQQDGRRKGKERKKEQMGENRRDNGKGDYPTVTDGRRGQAARMKRVESRGHIVMQHNKREVRDSAVPTSRQATRIPYNSIH